MDVAMAMAMAVTMVGAMATDVVCMLSLIFSFIVHILHFKQ